MASVPKIKELLEKTKHYDADERFMALRDLIEQLKLVSSASALDATSQTSLRDAILRLLDDGSSDVSTLAVSCLSHIVQKFSSDQVSAVVLKLASMVSDRERGASSRDVITDGLKTVIGALPEENGKIVAQTLIKQVLTGLNLTEKKEIDTEMACLTITKELVNRFGSDVSEFHSELVVSLLKLLEHSNDNVRKQSSVALAPLVLAVDDALFTSLMTDIVTRIESSKRPETYIQAVSAVSRSAGVRIGPFLEKIVPKLQRYVALKNVNTEVEESTEELWEMCLSAFESIILRCPSQVTNFLPAIVEIGRAFMKHDPNFLSTASSSSSSSSSDALDVEEDGFASAGGGDDDGWGDDSGGGGGGGGGWGVDAEEGAAVEASMSTDNSWKVRRAAVRVISAFIRARSDILKDYYSTIADDFVARFSDRDIAVKEEVLFATRDLLHESVVSGDAHGVHHENDDMPSPAPLLLRTRSSAETLESKLPNIFDACDREFKKADVRSQKALFTVLTELVIVRQGAGIADYLPRIVPQIIAGVESSGKAAEVNADALKLARLLLEYLPLEQLRDYLSPLATATMKGIKTGLPKNIPDSLGVLAAIAKLVSRAHSTGERELAQQLFATTFAQLDQRDVPLQLKLAAIHTMSLIISAFPDELASSTPKVLVVLIDRIKNDTTRQPTLRALTKISRAEKAVDLSVIVKETPELVSFMRKTGHHLREDTVKCFDALVQSQARAFSTDQLTAILNEVVTHLTDQDLALSHLILNLATTMVKNAPSSHQLVADQIVPRAIDLIHSPLIQGAALTSLITFFQTLVSSKSGVTALSFGHLLSSNKGSVLLHALNQTQLSKPALIALSQVIAGITLAVPIASALSETVVRFQKDASAKSEVLAQVALLVLGEIGKKRDLSSQNVELVCLTAFDSPAEGVRSSAAVALGNIAVGNLPKFLPSILKLITERPQHAYLLFNSLEEVIVTHNDATSMATFRPYVSTVLPLLQSHATSKEESVRSMVAECLGRLAIIDHVSLLPVIERLAKSDDKLNRAVATIAYRFALSADMDAHSLSDSLSRILPGAVVDSDISVRRDVLLSVNAVVRANVELLSRDTLLRDIIPALYGECAPKPELIYEVDFGAFKKTIDDGKPLRKAAFTCLATILEVCPHRLDLSQFLAHVQLGLKDLEDMQVLTYSIFIGVAAHPNHSQSLLALLDKLPTIMMPAVKLHLQNVKSTAAETQQAATDCLRAIVRALLAFNRIPGVQLCKEYVHFYKQVLVTPALAALVKEEAK